MFLNTNDGYFVCSNNNCGNVQPILVYIINKIKNLVQILEFINTKK